MEIQIPYGKGVLTANADAVRTAGIIRSGLDSYMTVKGEKELIEDAVKMPIDSPSLAELARGRKKVVVIASDHTRPVPSKLIMPVLLREIRSGNPEADITILIATGCHRETRREELRNKFGDEILSNERIIIHDCDAQDMVLSGQLPSGGNLWINRMAAEADLLVAEGFIEPHFFAGYSGGRKSILPGIAGRETIYANHCAEFINHSNARYGQLEGNPIHEDMIFAARKAGLAYILNVVINSSHRIIAAFAGDVDSAHKKGTAFLDRLCREKKIPADIVVTSNNGYPLDQNIYQAVKGLATAEGTVNPGGVIIMAAACDDGCGGDVFYETFRQAESACEVFDKISTVPRDRTEADQWQSQILARILTRHKVILISQCPDQMVRDLHMIPAGSLTEALDIADRILGHNKGSITWIPEGISSIVQ